MGFEPGAPGFAVGGVDGGGCGHMVTKNKGFLPSVKTAKHVFTNVVSFCDPAYEVVDTIYAQHCFLQAACGRLWVLCFLPSVKTAKHVTTCAVCFCDPTYAVVDTIYAQH